MLKMQKESTHRKEFHAKMKKEVAMRCSFQWQLKQCYAKNSKGPCKLGMRCAKAENNQQESGWTGSHVGE